MLALTLVTGCGGADPTTLPGSNWRLTTLRGAAPVEGTMVTLGIDTAGRGTGSGGCNRYFTDAVIEGDAISFGAVGATRMACEPPILDQEIAHFAGLEEATAFRLDGGSLTLLDAADAAIATFEATEAAAIDG